MIWQDVVAIGAEYPGCEVSTSYGTPSLKVRGKLMTRLRPEDDSLVLLDVALEEKAMLIEADPALFHTTPHYDGYPAILARLTALQPAQLRQFLDRRYRAVAGKRLLAEWRGRD
jgi:hypothetical protein